MLDLNHEAFSADEEKAIILIYENKQEIVKQLIKHLPKNWKWERLGFLEQAILINAIGEMTLFFNKKPIVINESVNFAKKYCEEKAYKLINGVLNNF